MYVICTFIPELAYEKTISILKKKKKNQCQVESQEFLKFIMAMPQSAN